MSADPHAHAPYRVVLATGRPRRAAEPNEWVRRDATFAHNAPSKG